MNGSHYIPRAEHIDSYEIFKQHFNTMEAALINAGSLTPKDMDAVQEYLEVAPGATLLSAMDVFENHRGAMEMFLESPAKFMDRAQAVAHYKPESEHVLLFWPEIKHYSTFSMVSCRMSKRMVKHGTMHGWVKQLVICDAAQKLAFMYSGDTVVLLSHLNNWWSSKFMQSKKLHVIVEPRRYDDQNTIICVDIVCQNKADADVMLDEFVVYLASKNASHELIGYFRAKTDGTYEVEMQNSQIVDRTFTAPTKRIKRPENQQ